MKPSLIRSVIILLLFAFPMMKAYSQYFISGQEPFSTRWYQIRTENYRIVFPQNYQPLALNTANTLEASCNAVYASLGRRPRNTWLLMHNYMATSNAFAVPAPLRMEFYCTPPQDSYAQPWIRQLALHEYRHIAQITMINQGFTKGISWLFGQQGIAGVMGLYIPFWFLEGDAICSETALSSSGRGRDPSFEMILRTQLLEKGIFPYDKAVFGTYRDRVPNQYELGYFLVAMGRKSYGPEIWQSALTTTARKPWMITPFSRGIRKTSGLKKMEFYRQSLFTLQSEWKEQAENTKLTPIHIHGKAPRFYTDYLHPVRDDEGNIYAIRSGIQDITRIIKIDKEGKETIIHTPGRIFTESLSWSQGLLCWSEKKTDPRWTNREYAEIKILDIKSGKTRKLTGQTRYFAPALSPEAGRIAAVETDPENGYSLVILDVNTAKVLQRFSWEYPVLPMTPAWSRDGKRICTILLGNEGKTMISISLNNGQTDTLLIAGFSEISNPAAAGKGWHFTASYSGIANIFFLDPEEKKITMITSAPYGCSYVAPEGSDETLIFSTYTAGGYRIGSIHPDEFLDKSLDIIENNNIRLYESIVSQENFNLDKTNIPDSTYEIKRFRRFPHLFHIHSWAPLSISATTRDIRPGVSVLSQNLLSTSILEAGYSWDVNEQTGKFYLDCSYQGFYPVIDLQASYGRRHDEYPLNGNNITYHWQETGIGARVRIPLDLTSGKYYKGIQPFVSYSMIFRNMEENSPVQFRKDDISSLGFGLYAYHNLKKSTRQIYPRWGQTLDLRYYYTPFDDIISSVAGGTLTLYMPGIMKNHGIRVSGAYQETKTGYYNYSDLILFPRGYSNLNPYEAICLRSTYALPLFYPDLSAGPIFYLQRVKLGLFYDQSWNRQQGQQDIYSSTGLELTGDMHIFRFLAPIELGLRCSYLIERQDVRYDLLFSVNFNSFYIGH